MGAAPQISVAAGSSPVTSARPPLCLHAANYNVLQVITPSRYSGAERVLVRIADRLVDRGHRMTSVISRHNPALSEMRAAGLTIEPLAIGGKANVLAPWRLAAAARQVKAELLHTHLSTASWWAGWLDRCGGPPSVGHVHGFTSAAWHRQQTHLIAVSQAVKDHLVAQGIAAEKVTVIHNAIDPSDVRPQRSPSAVRAEFGADRGTRVVGCFAHLSEKKGWRELMAAIPQILKEFPRTHFWCVGDGPLRRELQAAAQQGQFTSSVRFTGFRRDVADLMNAVDVVALPSHREPCALVLMEAALLAKPIVACRSGGSPEIITDGQTGRLAEPRDAGSVAAAIKSLLDNPVDAVRMGRLGHDRAVSEFTWPRFLDQLEAVYGYVAG